MSKPNTDGMRQIVHIYSMLTGMFIALLLISCLLSWVLHQRDSFTQIYCREYFGRCARIYPTVAISVWWPYVRAIGVGGLGTLLISILAAVLTLWKSDTAAKPSLHPLRRGVYLGLMLGGLAIILGLGTQISVGRGLWHPVQQSIPLVNIGIITSTLSLITLLIPSADRQFTEQTIKKPLLIGLGASLAVFLIGWIIGTATRHHSEYTEIQCFYNHCATNHPLGAFFAELWPRLISFSITAAGILFLSLCVIIMNTHGNDKSKMKASE